MWAWGPQWACSQMSKSSFKSHFGSRSASWLDLWFELRAFTSIATAFPITKRICALRGNILFLLRGLTFWPMHGFSAHFHNVNKRTIQLFAFMHESHSERALRSQVLRIRLSGWITIQNALFCVFQKPDLKELCVHKGSESRSEMAFGTWFAPLWTGPICNLWYSIWEGMGMSKKALVFMPQTRLSQTLDFKKYLKLADPLVHEFFVRPLANNRMRWASFDHHWSVQLSSASNL